MARLRSQTLNIARANGVTNIAKALWAAVRAPDDLDQAFRLIATSHSD
jgi:hypothetical protein